MVQKIIQLGLADKGNGDPLRTAFGKVNDNFTELFNHVSSGVIVSTTPPDAPGEGDLWWDPESGRMYVYYGSSWVDASPVDGAGISSTNQLVNGNLTASLGTNGTLTVPHLLPRTFTATVNSAHYYGEGSLTLSGTAWHFDVTFDVTSSGSVETQISNSTVWSSNPGYINGIVFRFTEADHGIPGYTFNLTLTDIQHPNPSVWTTNLAASVPPTLPATIKNGESIKLTADATSFIFGADGNIHLPSGGDIVDSNGDSVLGGGATTGNIEFTANTMYDLSGIIIENSDLSHGPTAALILPTNSNTPTPIQLNNLYGDITLQASSTGGGGLQTWTLGGDGLLTFPNGAGFGLGGSGQLKVNDSTTSSLDFRDTGGRGFYTNSDGFSLRSDGNSTWVFGGDNILTLPNKGSITMTGGSIGWSSSDDVNFNLILNSENNVLIQSNTVTTWTFGTDGNLTVPGAISSLDDNTLILRSNGTNGNSSSISVDGDNGRTLVRTDDGTTLHTWEFTTDGRLLLGNVGAIYADQTTGMVTIGDAIGPDGTPVAPSTVVNIGGTDNAFSISAYGPPAKSWAFGRDGSLTLPLNGNLIVDGTTYTQLADAEITYTDNEVMYQDALTQWMTTAAFKPVWFALSGREAYDLIIAWTTPNGVTPPPVNLVPLAYACKTSYLTWQDLIVDSKLAVKSDTTSFEFDSTGKLTLPNGGTIAGGDPTAVQAAYDAWQATEDDWTYLITNGGLRLDPRPWTYAAPDQRQATVLAMWQAQMQGGITINWAAISQSFYTQVRAWLAVNTNAAVLYNNWKKLSTSVNITAEDSTWTFTNDGAITFPNDTVQTTAFTGLQTSLVSPNTNYSLTVNNYGTETNSPIKWMEGTTERVILNYSPENDRFVIATGYSGTPRYWYFGDDGKLTLPAVGAQIANDVTFTGSVTFQNTANYVQSTNTVYTDSLIELHAPTGGIGNPWTTNDGNDIGLRFHYYNGADKNAALFLDNGTWRLKFVVDGTESGGQFTHSGLGDIEAANFYGNLNGSIIGSTVAKTGFPIADLGITRVLTLTPSPSNDGNWQSPGLSEQFDITISGTTVSVKLYVDEGGNMSVSVISSTSGSVSVGASVTINDGVHGGNDYSINPVTVTVASVSSGIPTAIDLTKSVNELTDGAYSLANGVEGQILYLTTKFTVTSPSAIRVQVATFRTNGSASLDYILRPFSNSGVCMLVYNNSSWQASNISSVPTLTTARNINGVAFDGSADITVTAAAGTLTGTTLNSTVVSSSLTSLGTITSLRATTATGASISTASSTGFIGMPQNSRATAYTLAYADQGRHIYVTATSTITIPANSTTAFPIGTTIDIVSGAGATTTIAITTDTMYLAGAGTTGSRTLAAHGWATLVKVSSTVWYIRGNGLT